MELTRLNRKTLNIPSASGIEITGDKIYMMGDDSPWLFQLNQQFEVVDKLAIGDISAAVQGKIPKPQKPDLEAMAAFGNELLLFGSGSKSPQRDVLVKVNTDTKTTSTYSLVQFYDNLCSVSKLSRNELNIEAAVIVEEKLFLFNRGKNKIFKLNVREFLNRAERNAPVPSTQIFSATLPSLNGIEAGFSGAGITPDGTQIVFSASIENTPNWIDDGEILGSFVGIFSLSELNDSFNPTCIAITDKENNILKIKVESVAVRGKISPDKMQILLVTDNDASSSEIIEAELER